MRIISVDVENFAGIRKARIEVGPGLTILHGPNELGKSTLVEAIRAALLLQSNSNHATRWIPWDTDDTPQVKLVFETEPERFYRVTKSFGQGARSKALLDESRDNHSYTNLSSGRDVDGQLRRLLQWGIPEPGRGAPRGLPESFLTSVLLPQQAEATRLFERSLENDPDDSGRNLLTEALEAMATDPLFAEAIQAAQRKVDEAFTSTGRRRKGRNSPFLQISEQIKALEQDLKNAEEQQRETVEIQQQIKELADRHAEREKVVEQLEAELQRSTDLLEKRQKVESNLDQWREKLKKLDSQKEELEAAERDVADLNAKATKASENATAAEQGLKAGRRELQEIEIRIRESQSSESAARLEADKQRRATQLAEARNREEQLKTAEHHAARREDLEKRRDKLEQECDQLEQERQKASKQVEAAVQQIEKLTLEHVLRQQASLRDRMQRSRATIDQCEQLIEKQQRQRSELAKLTEERQNLQAPSPEQVQAIEQLQQRLGIERSKLEVGLSLQIELEANKEVELGLDDQDSSAVGSGSFEAKRVAQIKIPGTGTIRVRAGEREQQEQVETLEQQWQAEAVPLLNECECKTAEELATRLRQSESLDAQIAELQRSLEASRDVSKELDNERADLESMQSRAESLEHQLGEFEPLIVEAGRNSLANKPPRPIEQLSAEITRLERELPDLREQRTQANSDLQHRQSSLQETLEAIERETQQFGELDPSDEYRQRQAEQREVIDRLTKEVDELESSRETDLQELEARQKELQARVEQLEVEARKADEAAQEAEGEHNRAVGVVHTLQRAYDEGSRDEARKQTDELERQLEAYSATSPETVGELRERLTEQRRLRDDTSRQKEQKEGGLQHVEGHRAEERCRELREALNQAKNREQRIIQEFEAWKLLLDTLVEVERQEMGHLGATLGPRLALQLTELGRQSFTEVHLDAELKMSGVEVSGVLRELRLLSQGMQDQFSTILRVHLAAQLGSFLVLDDQLVHSDPERMRWLCRLLANQCEKCQILIFTCRPDEYCAELGENAAVVDLCEHLERIEVVP